MKMTSLLFGHVTNICGFISTSKRTITTKRGRMLSQHAHFTLRIETASQFIGHVTKIYLHFYQVYNNQTWKNVRPAYNDFTLHMTMTPPPKDYVINIYSLSPLFRKNYYH